MRNVYTDEADYQRSLQLHLEARGWRTQAHEDRFMNFIPDVSFAAHSMDGWVEVKYCKRRPATIGSIPHYTRGQEKWLRDFGATGSGHCYLLVGSPHEHLLLRWDLLKDARPMTWSDALKIGVTRDSLTEMVAAMDSGIRR